MLLVAALDAVLLPRSHRIFRASNPVRHFSSDIFGTAAKGSSMPKSSMPKSSMSKSSPQVTLHYADYLKLAALLSTQEPESTRHGRPAHDHHRAPDLRVVVQANSARTRPHPNRFRRRGGGGRV